MDDHWKLRETQVRPVDIEFPPFTNSMHRVCSKLGTAIVCEIWVNLATYRENPGKFLGDITDDQVELEDPEGAVLVEAGGVSGVPHSEHSGLGAGGAQSYRVGHYTGHIKIWPSQTWYMIPQIIPSVRDFLTHRKIWPSQTWYYRLKRYIIPQIILSVRQSPLKISDTLNNLGYHVSCMYHVWHGVKNLWYLE